jgi:hypothetical protein
MDADEAAHREAQEKAAALFHLGWENGAGATIWARVIQDQMALHDSGRERLAADTGDMETWERLYGSALVLVVAVVKVCTLHTVVSLDPVYITASNLVRLGEGEFTGRRRSWSSSAPSAVRGSSPTRRE